MTTLSEKIAVVDHLIEDFRWARSRPDVPEHGTYNTLKALADDLRGRFHTAPSVALIEIERRMTAVKNRPVGSGADRVNAQIGVAEELTCRWPTVRQALENMQRQPEDAR